MEIEWGIIVMKTKSTRLQYIDIAKGIAMICIILDHYSGFVCSRIFFKKNILVSF